MAPLVVQRDTWCQDVRHQIGDAAGANTYQLLFVGPLFCLINWCGGPCTVALIDLGWRVYLREVRGVEQLVLSNVPPEVWTIDPYNIASLMVLAMVLDFLPTMEKLSNLV